MLENLSDKLPIPYVQSCPNAFRNLDFSYEGRLTSVLDIQQYFSNENINKFILKVNLRNVHCIGPERMLNDYIGKALNLVDINIHGTELKDLRQLGYFLNPLLLVTRLSIDWPVTGVDDATDYADCRQVLQKSFNRLTYLSVRTLHYPCLWELVYMVDLCQELKELYIFHGNGESDLIDFGGISTELVNLEVFEFCGDFASSYKEEFLDLLPEPEVWTGFGLSAPLVEKCFHLEKYVEICEELSQSNCIEYLPDSWEWTLGNCLRSECLLREVIRITQKKVPEELCLTQCYSGERCALKIEDAKLLLKNPRHQIKYLYLGDSIGTTCTVHLFALAAPNLTELYLSDVLKVKRPTSKQIDFEAQDDPMNRSLLQDPSFGMLVKNTPFVKDLTLNGRPGKLEDDEAWDLGALYLIRRWKNLKSLRLLSIPLSDGEFLIDIGKHCAQLEKLELNNLGPSSACCYTKELSLMLTHCQNLTDFTMFANNIGLVSEVFDSLSKNQKLKRVCLTSSGEMNNTVNMVSSVEKLVRRCTRFTTFVCIIDGISQAFSDQLTSVLRGLRVELNRQTLQFQVVRKSNSDIVTEVDTVREDSPPPSFPYTWDDLTENFS